MNKIKAKNITKKVLLFVFLRAFELTVFYFFVQFAARYFGGTMFYVVCGAVLFAYLFYLIGCFVDDYREWHRYDDVVL